MDYHFRIPLWSLYIIVANRCSSSFIRSLFNLKLPGIGSNPHNFVEVGRIGTLTVVTFRDRWIPQSQGIKTWNQLFWQFEHVLLLTEHKISNRNQETHQQTRIIFKRTNSHVGDLMANESLRINLGSKLWKSYPVIGPPENIGLHDNHLRKQEVCFTRN